MTGQLKAPFPYFGGKRDVASEVWRRFGRPKQYIEPFCGSAAILLAAPKPASLEVVGDINGFIANFWRAVVHHADAVATACDYPVSHLDLGARHRWLMSQRERIGAELQDPDWQGDAKVAGWWLWGQCAWIGSGWCEWTGQIPHVSSAGQGIQAVGKIPHIGNAGQGMWTTCGATAMQWLRRLATRLERVRVVHGSWDRCLNHHYGGDDTAIVLDPPYEGYEELYRAGTVIAEVTQRCRENSRARIALCGHRGDYELPGWSVFEWDRSALTYGGGGTKAEEAIWFSPACRNEQVGQRSLFG